MGVCGGGDNLPSLISFKFEYVSKESVLIPNMALTFVYAFFTESYEHFKFES